MENNNSKQRLLLQKFSSGLLIKFLRTQLTALLGKALGAPAVSRGTVTDYYENHRRSDAKDLSYARLMRTFVTVRMFIRFLFDMPHTVRRQPYIYETLGDAILDYSPKIACCDFSPRRNNAGLPHLSQAFSISGFSPAKVFYNPISEQLYSISAGGTTTVGAGVALGSQVAIKALACTF